MKYMLRITGFVFICASVLICSCKKSPSEFNFSTALTATFNNAAQQYIAPSGLVNTTAGYSISGYQSQASNNTILLTIDSAISGLDTFGKGVNSLLIINNGTTYSTSYNKDAFKGSANITIVANKVTGTFNAVLYTNPNAVPAVPKDSLIVTNGTISTNY